MVHRASEARGAVRVSPPLMRHEARHMYTGLQVPHGPWRHAVDRSSKRMVLGANVSAHIVDVNSNRLACDCPLDLQRGRGWRACFGAPSRARVRSERRVQRGGRRSAIFAGPLDWLEAMRSLTCVCVHRPERIVQRFDAEEPGGADGTAGAAGTLCSGAVARGLSAHCVRRFPPREIAAPAAEPMRRFSLPR